MTQRWKYQGDINLEYGGTFVEFSEWKNGYVNVVEVTDLDSACGFRNAILIESRSVMIDKSERWEDALSVIGASLMSNDDIEINGTSTYYRKETQAWRWCLVHALNYYGAYDTDRTEVVQPDPNLPLEYDGWHAMRIRSNGLRSHIRRKFLGYRR